MTSGKIANASAIVVLTTMAMTWISPRGLGVFMGDISGYELMMKYAPFLIFTPIGAIASLGILVYAETNPDEYGKRKVQFAKIRMITSFLAAMPVLIVLLAVLNYSQGMLAQQYLAEEPTYTMWEEMIGLSRAFSALLTPIDPGEGLWLSLISVGILAIEAFIDFRHTKA